MSVRKYILNPQNYDPKYLKQFSEADIPTNIENWLNLVEKSIKAELSWQKMTLVPLKEYIQTINGFLKTKHNACIACGSFMRKIHSDFQVALWKYAQKYIPMFLPPLPDFKSAKLNGQFWQNQLPVLSFEMLQNQIDILVNDSVRERKKNPSLSAELNYDAVALRQYKKAKLEYFSSEMYNLLMWAAEKKDEELDFLENIDNIDNIEINEKQIEENTIIDINNEENVNKELKTLENTENIENNEQQKIKKSRKTNSKKVEIDKEKLDKLVDMGLKLQEIADVLGVSATAVFYAKGGARKTKKKENGTTNESSETKEEIL